MIRALPVKVAQISQLLLAEVLHTRPCLLICRVAPQHWPDSRALLCVPTPCLRREMLGISPPELAEAQRAFGLPATRASRVSTWMEFAKLVATKANTASQHPNPKP